METLRHILVSQQRRRECGRYSGGVARPCRLGCGCGTTIDWHHCTVSARSV